MGNDGNEYKIIVQVFLYKYFNDKFGYEAKRTPVYGKRLTSAKKWDEEYDKFTDDEIEDLFTYLPSNTPKMRPEHTIAHLYNASGQGDFSNLFDSTMVSLIFSLWPPSTRPNSPFSSLSPSSSPTRRREISLQCP